ncbi:ribbon-helix-helix domain-containing protein [Zavarzinella formosa]|uniref:ribbon-helix-helix domain-containing protein n=1 Tax=Zavarzinella formosa TaxID=360055 RepID=UPI0002D5E724|nr:hypothetical protein [Zavarzinella formosa]
MTTLTLELTDDQRAFVESQHLARGFATVGEYLRELIRQDADLAEAAKAQMQMQDQIERLKTEQPDEYERAMNTVRQAIDKGLASGPPIKMTGEEWKKLWAEADDEFERTKATEHA